MTHPRQLIRHAAVTLLTGNTDAGARVYATRIPPWKKPELPAIAVYTSHEEVDEEASKDTGPRILRRIVDLEIEAAVAMGGNVDDAMDALAAQIEKVMAGNPWLGFTDDTVYDSILSATEMDTGEAGQAPVGVVRLTYRVEFYTDAPALADQSALADFTLATQEVSLEGAQATADQAKDQEIIPIT